MSRWTSSLSTARGITRLTGTLKSQLKPPTRDVPMHSAPRTPGRRRRRRAVQWAFADQGPQKLAGVYKRGDKGVWTQWIKQGRAMDFDEWERNPRYVTLVNGKQKLALRMHADHCDIPPRPTECGCRFATGYGRKRPSSRTSRALQLA